MIDSGWVEVPQKVTWVRDRTIVRCYDGDVEIADFDGSTGLSFLYHEEDGKHFITPDDRVFPAGRWVFDGSYQVGGVNAPVSGVFVHLEGTCNGEWYSKDRLLQKYSQEIPWDYPSAPFLFAPYGEREERMKICRSCDLYDQITGQCTMDLNFMPSKTKYSQEVCPVGKWSESSNFTKEEYEKRISLTPKIPSNEEQDSFEKEWEERNAR